MSTDSDSYSRVGTLIVGRRLIVEADGGSRGNPGPAAYGTVVRDAETREVLFEEGAAIGVDTNNVAEYRGLIAGLVAAKEIDAHPHVEARLDSKLIVEQMSGRWKIKHDNMKRLAQEAKAVLPSGSVRYTWVPRSENTTADKLVNLALDGQPMRRFREGEQDETDAEGERAPNALVGWSTTHPDVTTTVLLRHGATIHTTHKRFSGWGGDDPGLSDGGRQQAEQVATHLKSASIDAIVSSPMLRTTETADVIASALGLEVALDDDLRECSFGEWDGLTFAEAQQRWPDERHSMVGRHRHSTAWRRVFSRGCSTSGAGSTSHRGCSPQRVGAARDARDPSKDVGQPSAGCAHTCTVSVAREPGFTDTHSVVRRRARLLDLVQRDHAPRLTLALDTGHRVPLAVRRTSRPGDRRASTCWRLEESPGSTGQGGG